MSRVRIYAHSHEGNLGPPTMKRSKGPSHRSRPCKTAECEGVPERSPSAGQAAKFSQKLAGGQLKSSHHAVSVGISTRLLSSRGCMERTLSPGGEASSPAQRCRDTRRILYGSHRVSPELWQTTHSVRGTEGTARACTAGR